MDTPNIDFKQLWANQSVQPPDLSELKHRLQAYKKESWRQTIIATVTLGATAAFILFVWYYFEPQFLTTKLGITTIIAAITRYIVAMRGLSTLFYQIDESMSNQQYLDHFLAIKTKQQRMHTRDINLYFVLLSVGLALYMYEYTSRMSILWATVAYAVVGVWIAFNWFYFRPRVIRKQQVKVNELIERLERVREQV